MSSNPSPDARSRPSRRGFLAATGLGVMAAALPAGSAAAAAPAAAPAEKAPKKARPPEVAPTPVEKPWPFAFQLGLASYSLRNFDLDTCLAMTKRAGLQYICLKSMHLPLDATPEAIHAAADKVRQAGLVLYGCGVVTMRKPADVEQAFEYAKAAGMSRIVAMPLPEVLPLLNDKVQQYDIRICIHNHGPGDKVWPVPDGIYEKVKGLDRRIGLCIDIGHTVRAGVDLIACTERCADRLFELHMKDVNATTEKGKAIEVGRGLIDIPRFLRTLVKVKYAGVISFEYEIFADDPLPGLAESVGYTKGVLATMS